MGLLSKLLLFPVTGPINGFQFILEQIRDEAEMHLANENQLITQLMRLNHLYDLGKLSDDEFTQQERAILDEINAIRAERQELVNQELALWQDETYSDDGQDDKRGMAEEQHPE